MKQKKKKLAMKMPTKKKSKKKSMGRSTPTHPATKVQKQDRSPMGSTTTPRANNYRSNNNSSLRINTQSIGVPRETN